MTDIAPVVASLACCGGLFVLCAVAWANVCRGGIGRSRLGGMMTLIIMVLLGWIALGIICAALQALIDDARHRHVEAFIARMDEDEETTR